MSERQRLEIYIQGIRRKGWFRQRYTEISWTPNAVVINGKSYTTVHDLRKALAQPQK